MNKMTDKYDADDLRLAEKIVNFVDPTMEWATMERTVAVWIAEYRRSAFPPPAEDARQCVRRINETVHYDKTIPGLDHWSVDVLKAEVEAERFAESRVEQRESEMIVRAIDWWLHDPDIKGKGAIARMKHALLSDSPAKEAEK